VKRFLTAWCLAVLLLAAACRSAPPPASPGRPQTLPGGLVGQSVGAGDGGDLIGETGGCLIGFYASPSLPEGDGDGRTDAESRRKAKELFDRAVRTDDVVTALGLLDESLALDPDRPETLNDKGLLLYCRGDVAAARRAFETAIAKSASFRPARRNLDRLFAVSR
jgi:hypothetical protein